jgi:hypothetical protein
MTAAVTFGADRICHICGGRGRRLGRDCLACGATGIERSTPVELVAIGRRERDDVMVAVDAASIPWRVDAATWFARQAPDATFSADDLTRHIGQPSSRAAVGTAFSIAARRGIIERVGVAPSGVPTSHASIVGIWRRTWKVAA